MRRSSFRLALGLLVLSSSVTLQGCLRSDSLVFHKISKLRFEKKGNDTYMAADVWLENKSSFRCDVIATQAEILVDNKHLGTLSLLEPTRLEAHSSQQWPCKLEIRAQDLFSSLPSGLELLIGDKKIPTQVRGTVIARIFLFKRSFGFDVRQDLDAKMLGSMF